MFGCTCIAVKAVFYMKPMKSRPPTMVCCFGCDEVSLHGHVVLLCLCSCLHWCCSALPQLFLSVSRTVFRRTTSSTLYIRCIDTPTASHPYDTGRISPKFTLEKQWCWALQCYSLGCNWSDVITWFWQRRWSIGAPDNDLDWCPTRVKPSVFWNASLLHFHYLGHRVSQLTNFS